MLLENPVLERLRILKREPRLDGGGLWHSLATAVMRRPLVIALGVAPCSWRSAPPSPACASACPTTGSCPPRPAAARRPTSCARSSPAATPPPCRSSPPPPGDLDAHAATLSTVPGVARVDGPKGSYLGGRLVVPGDGNPLYQRFVGPRGGAHDRGASTGESVAKGLERTGRIVTAAAALLAIVFLSFATSGITFIKLFGLGLTLAVLMDATLTRGALVPAFMRRAGDANWWSPGPLRRLHDRFGFTEGPSDLAEPGAEGIEVPAEDPAPPVSVGSR